jgi:PAS domain-containing protein
MKTDASEPQPRFPRRLRLVLDALPKGRALPLEDWERRHRGILVVLWLNAVGLACFGVLAGYGWTHSLLEGAVVAPFGILGWWPRRGRAFRAVAASLGLLTSSAVLVHLSGGYIEMHFHFFVMVSVIALYQDWVPFLVAIGYVLVQHGVLGAIDPGSVYNHPAGVAHPWRWAAIHAAFVLGASVASIVNWRAHEAARARTELILDSAGEGIYGLDPSGHATFVNAAAATMLGWEVDEVLGRPMHALLHHSKPDGTPYPPG